jgi:hypothetical protein
MTTNYPAMLRTAGQVQGAMAATWFNLAGRASQFAMQGITEVARAGVAPLLADNTDRQTACEDAIWTAYSAHQQYLRALTGASRLSLLVFLNELDRRRGARPMPSEATML